MVEEAEFREVDARKVIEGVSESKKVGGKGTKMSTAPSDRYLHKLGKPLVPESMANTFRLCHPYVCLKFFFLNPV